MCEMGQGGRSHWCGAVLARPGVAGSRDPAHGSWGRLTSQPHAKSRPLSPRRSSKAWAPPFYHWSSFSPKCSFTVHLMEFGEHK